MPSLKRPAPGRAAAHKSQDQATSRAGQPENLPSARPTSAGTGRSRGRRGQGLRAGPFVAKRPSASSTALEGSFAPRTALPSPGGKGNGSTRCADTPDIGDRQSESVADGRPRGSNEDIPCSQLPFHDFSNESEKRSFRMITDALAADQILVTRLYGPDNSFYSETAFGVLDEQDREQGPLPDFGFLGASRDLQDFLVAVLADDRDTVLYLH